MTEQRTEILTQKMIHALCDEAAAAGDQAMADMCFRALRGEDAARVACAEAISTARERVSMPSEYVRVLTGRWAACASYGLDTEVWGVGQTADDAEDDAEANAWGEDNVGDWQYVEITAEQWDRFEDGEVSCKALGIDLDDI